jgi:hypothetical protein
MRALSLARLLLGLGAAAALALAARFALASPERAIEPASVLETAPDPALPPRADSDSMARIIAGRDVFRASRASASVRYDSRAADQPALPPPQAPPRPALVLVGIVAGSEPAALLDGVPGSESTRVLRAGDRFGAYTLRSIAAGEVVIAGPDTTWTLRLRTPSP